MDEFTPRQEQYLNCVIQELDALGVKAEARKFPFEEYPVWMRLDKDLIAVHDGGKGVPSYCPRFSVFWGLGLRLQDWEVL